MGAYRYTPNPGDPAYGHSLPHATRGAGGNTYGYDSRGNQVWRAGPNIRGTRQNLTYNSLNQLTRIQSGGGTTGAPTNVMDFAYDAEGALLLARKGDSETVFVEKLYKQHREAGELVEETHTIMVEGRPVAEISRDAVSGAWATSYVHTDRLGSPEWLSNAQGVVARGRKYGAFGQLKEAGGKTEIGYTGHLDLAEFGLVHAGGRVYDPELARFLSADPFVRSALNSQSLNRYSYVENNPMNAVDPSGLQVVIPIFGGRSCGPNLKQCVDNGESESSVLPNPYIVVVGDGNSGGGDDGWAIIDEVHGEIWSPNNAPETPPLHAPASVTPSAVTAGSALPNVGGDSYVEIFVVSRSVGSPRPGEGISENHHAAIVFNVGRGGQNEHWILQGGPTGDGGLSGGAQKVDSGGWVATFEKSRYWDKPNATFRVPVKVITQIVAPRGRLDGSELERLADRVNSDFKDAAYKFPGGPNSNTWAARVLEVLNLPTSLPPNAPPLPGWNHAQGGQ